jgi:hypothetical protein
LQNALGSPNVVVFVANVELPLLLGIKEVHLHFVFYIGIVQGVKPEGVARGGL